MPHRRTRRCNRRRGHEGLPRLKALAAAAAAELGHSSFQRRRQMPKTLAGFALLLLIFPVGSFRAQVDPDRCELRELFDLSAKRTRVMQELGYLEKRLANWGDRSRPRGNALLIQSASITRKSSATIYSTQGYERFFPHRTNA